MIRVKETVICLVGSVKQVEDWRKWTEVLTRRGYVVLEAGWYGADKSGISEEEKRLQVDVHSKKLDLANVIGIIEKPDGSLGKGTERDIDHARARGKVVIPVGFIGENFP